jgi:ribosomal protein S18 acetylase RimI-like enzyme
VLATIQKGAAMSTYPERMPADVIDCRSADKVTPEFTAAYNGLIRQLSPQTAPLTQAQLRQMVMQPHLSIVMLTTDTGQPVAVLTLTITQYPSGLRAHVDDVVVDEFFRGYGLGDALMDTAIAHAQRLGVAQLELTSRPARQAARSLYERHGFQQRETTVYQLRVPAQRQAKDVA